MIKSLNRNRNYCNYLYDLDCVNKIECEYWKNNTVSMNNTITKVSLVSNNGVTNGIYKVELNELHNNEVIVEKVGISDKLKSYPHELSGGEQQRVVIARALIINPKIIFADEPTGNLDKQNSEEIMELFKQINKDTKVTILQVTHSQDMANYSNRIIKLLDGEIISDSKKKKHKK